MKKYLKMMAVMMMATTFLIGCPATNNLQDVVNDASATDTASTKAPDPVATVPTNDAATNTDVGQDEIPAGMGAVVVNGSFYDDVSKSLEKAINLNDVVDFFKEQVTVMQFSFAPMSSVGMGKATVPIKGSGSGGLDFRVPVVDGQYSGRFFLTPDDYRVVVLVFDSHGYTLFSAESEVSVIAGQNCHFDVVLYLNEMRYFNSRFRNFPAPIVTPDRLGSWLMMAKVVKLSTLFIIIWIAMTVARARQRQAS